MTSDTGHGYFVKLAGAVVPGFDAQTTEAVTIAGQFNVHGNLDGMGLQGQVNWPRSMTSDNGGTLFLADHDGYQIRSYSVATTEVGTFAGEGVQGYVDAIGV